MGKRQATGATARPRRFDSHAHGDPTGYRGSPSAYVRRMRKEGIDGVLLIADGEQCVKGVRRFGDFIIPVAWAMLDEVEARDLRGEVERHLDRGCKGIKFIRPLHPYADERYWPLYDIVEQRRAVAVFHTGYLAFTGRETRPIQFKHMRAAEIDTIARRFPDLRILMAHFSNPWWEEAWKVSWSRPNVYADLSGGTAIRRSLAMWSETFAPNGELMADSVAKLCFGSDTHYFRPGEHRFQPYIDFYERLLERIQAPPSLRRKVWAGNLQKLFCLER
jgi:predicted TIM-barrel fold metal-dependent hydrolase